jgi:hypothetical protein
MTLQKDSNYQQKEIRESQQIPLWAEKLTVNRRQRKVGEVVVRKQVETRMIQVPIKEEKLIIERIGENPEQLAEVVIGTSQINGVPLDKFSQTDTLHITKSHYLSIEMAQNFLKALALLPSAANSTIRLEIISDSSEEQIKHQQICDRFTAPN